MSAGAGSAGAGAASGAPPPPPPLLGGVLVGCPHPTTKIPTANTNSNKLKPFIDSPFQKNKIFVLRVLRNDAVRMSSTVIDPPQAGFIPGLQKNASVRTAPSNFRRKWGIIDEHRGSVRRWVPDDCRTNGGR
jgi:hypothetical protein